MSSIDLTDEKLDFAKKIGAVATINAAKTPNVVKAVKEITNGGAHMSIDALGHPTTCYNSISNLRRRGRHVQVGLMLGEHAKPQIPMAKVIAFELEILRQPRHAGLPLPGDDGDDPHRQAEAGTARRKAHRPRMRHRRR